MSDSPADDSKDVLDKVKADGTFDQMRQRVTEAVKKSVSMQPTLQCTYPCGCLAAGLALTQWLMLQGTLTQAAEDLVATTEVFSTGKADTLSRKELFELIRKKHE